jgi:hypothetical protein
VSLAKGTNNQHYIYHRWSCISCVVVLQNEVVMLPTVDNRDATGRLRRCCPIKLGMLPAAVMTLEVVTDATNKGGGATSTEGRCYRQCFVYGGAPNDGTVEKML